MCGRLCGLESPSWECLTLDQTGQPETENGDAAVWDKFVENFNNNLINEIGLTLKTSLMEYKSE